MRKKDIFKEKLFSKIKGENDLQKFLKKLLKNSIIVFLVGWISVYEEDARYLVFIPVIKAVLNWIKNR